MKNVSDETEDDDPTEQEVTAQRFIDLLASLGLTRAEFAADAGLAERTVRSYGPRDGGTPVPGPVVATVRLMRRLKDHGLPWRLSGRTMVPPGMRDSALSAKARRRAMRNAVASFFEVDEIVQRLRTETRPLAPWAVDLERECAQLGTLELRFKRRPEGGFVPLSYFRSDDAYDAAADWTFLVDGFGCIARALESENESFIGSLQLARAKRMPAGYAMWEERLSPRLVVVIPDSAFCSPLVGEDLEERRRFLDDNRTRLARYLAQISNYESMHDPRTGLLTVVFDAEMFAAAKLLRRVFRDSSDTGEDA